MKHRFGASFSIKYARELGLYPEGCLLAALKDLKVRRLRLMSYWDEHEALRGLYNFDELDWQFKLAEKYKAEVTLCLGLRQPRWPESHWPHWAKDLPEDEWRHELMEFIRAVVERYYLHPSLVSYQLENEALLKNFGVAGNFDRNRLQAEFNMVKDLDPNHPVIMTASNSWGLPLGKPTPDLYGFSAYKYRHNARLKRYVVSPRPVVFYRLRALTIKCIKRRQTFIHELQAEPWGPKATVELDLAEQFKSMPLEHVIEAVDFARRTKLYPVDIWGLEWWYYLKVQHGYQAIWDYMRDIYSEE